MRQLKISKSITNRESQSLEKYLQEIGRLSLISPEEEVELAKKIRNGDQIALDKLTKANLRFVVSVAKQYQNQGLSLPDLINEGNLGLIKAAQRFDETKGFKFISYAVWWIRQSILQALAEQARIIRMPLNKVGLYSRITKMYSTLEQQLEREPSAEEVAAAMEIDVNEVLHTLASSSRHVSMDAPMNSNNDEGTLVEVLLNPNAENTDAHIDNVDGLQVEISRALNTLTDRQKEIIILYYGIGMEDAVSLEDIAEKFDLTRERVRQIKDKALLKLRTISKTKILKDYLGN